MSPMMSPQTTPSVGTPSAAVSRMSSAARRTLSSSYALRPDDAAYADFVAALGALFDDWQEGGRVRVRTRALCYLGAPADPKGEEHG